MDAKHTELCVCVCVSIHKVRHHKCLTRTFLWACPKQTCRTSQMTRWDLIMDVSQTKQPIYYVGHINSMSAAVDVSQTTVYTHLCVSSGNCGGVPNYTPCSTMQAAKMSSQWRACPNPHTLLTIQANTRFVPKPRTTYTK